MATIRSLTVALRTDTSGFEAGLNQAAAKTREFTQQIAEQSRREQAAMKAATGVGGNAQLSGFGQVVANQARLAMDRSEQVANWQRLFAQREAERAVAAEQAGQRIMGVRTREFAANLQNEEQDQRFDVIRSARWLKAQMRVAVYARAVSVAMDLAKVAVEAARGDWEGMDKSIGKIPLGIGAAYEATKGFLSVLDGSAKAAERLAYHVKQMAKGEEAAVGAVERGKQLDAANKLIGQEGTGGERVKIESQFQEAMREFQKRKDDAAAAARAGNSSWGGLSPRQNEMFDVEQKAIEERRQRELEEVRLKERGQLAKDADEAEKARIEATMEGYQRELALLEIKQRQERDEHVRQGYWLKNLLEKQAWEREELKRKEQEREDKAHEEEIRKANEGQEGPAQEFKRRIEQEQAEREKVEEKIGELQKRIAEKRAGLAEHQAAEMRNASGVISSPSSRWGDIQSKLIRGDNVPQKTLDEIRELNQQIKILTNKLTAEGVTLKAAG